MLRYTAWRVQPRNYLLFACHLTNSAAQLVQEARFVNYWYMGGREKSLGAPGVDAAKEVKSEVLQAVEAAEAKAANVEKKVVGK